MLDRSNLTGKCYANTFVEVRFVITFARAVCHWGYEEEDDCHIFLRFYPQVANVWWKCDNKSKSLNNCQVEGLSLQLKNGCLEILEFLALFLLKTET